jgi:uncharacterized protein (TIGR02757 family)
MTDAAKRLRAYLESLYETFNRREFVSPDPLQFLYRYADPADREIAALVCATLAYGRVAQIIRSLETVLGRLGPSPAGLVMHSTPRELADLLGGIKHRFTTGPEMARLLSGARKLVKKYGSLGACLRGKITPADTTILPALGLLTAELHGACAGLHRYTLSLPQRGSACKRLNLWLRWLVRRDDVDPGGWEGISPRLLVVPLDTHMDAIGRALGFTCRRQPDLKTALEITGGFREIRPDDPVRYDFALTRFGIRAELEIGHVTGNLRKICRPST